MKTVHDHRSIDFKFHLVLYIYPAVLIAVAMVLPWQVISINFETSFTLEAYFMTIHTLEYFSSPGHGCLNEQRPSSKKDA